MSDLFIPYLDQIIQATISGKMIWSKPNPSSYVWTTQKPTHARIVVQEVKSSGPGIVRATRYFLQAHEREEGTPKVALESTTNAVLALKLRELYNTIAFSYDKQSANFLKSILPS